MSAPDLDPKLADTRPGPRLRMRMPNPPDPAVRHRALHPVEAMNDLAVGLAVGAAAVLVDRSSSGIGIALTLAVLGYTVWHDAALVANRVSLRASDVRWALVVTAVAGGVMTLATPGVLGATGLSYALAYWAARLALARAVWARPEFGWGMNPYTMSAFFSGPLLVAGCLAEGDARLAIWVSAAIHDVAVPFILRNRTAGVPDDAEHLADRYSWGVGTMVLSGGIVLLGVGTRSGGVWWAVGAVATAILLMGLWWAYVAVFRPAQVFPVSEPTVARHVVSYGHLALASGAVLVVGGVRLVLAEPATLGDWWVAGLLGTGLVVAYGGLAGVSSWLLGRPQWVLWLACVGAILPVAIATYVPGAATLVVAAAVAGAVAWYARPMLPAITSAP